MKLSNDPEFNACLQDVSDALQDYVLFPVEPSANKVVAACSNLALKYYGDAGQSLVVDSNG
jgi:hypothetical protein